MFYAHLVNIPKMMAETAHVTSPREKHSVFKLPPECITSFNTNVFKPYASSFGPYHYNEQHLQHMEAHKLRSLKRFLNNTNQTLEYTVRSFKPMEQQLMDHYDQLGHEWRGGDCFLELMIRDGCFMLDVIKSKTRYAQQYSGNDPVFGLNMKSNVLCSIIRRDMLLIENQLPLLVLDMLISHNTVVLEQLKDENIEDRKKLEEHDITEEEFIHKLIHELISEFLGIFGMNIKSDNVLCLHALDVCRENFIQRPIQRHALTKVTPRAKVPPASVLRYTGVTFIKNHTVSFMDITFENGFLTLPGIIIYEETETAFLNVMAFERFQTSKAKEVSAYIDFMASLVCSVKDVSFLRSMGLIWTDPMMGVVSDKEIVAIFHKLAKNQIVDPDDSLDEVRSKLQYHYKEHFQKGWWNHWNERIAEWGSNFKQTYFKNPWTVIGLVAGIILLILTVTQTMYAVLSYYRKDH